MKRYNMQQENTILVKGFWDKKYTGAILITALLVFFSNCVVYSKNLVPFGFIAGGFAVTAVYFVLNNYFFHRWVAYSVKRFETTLFIYALCIRVAATVILYYFFIYQTGEPFEYHAADSKFYHETAKLVATHFSMMDFNTQSYLGNIGFSDRGYNIYLGIIYSIFGPSVLIARLINALLSALTVLLVSRIARNVAGEAEARLTGISALLLPNFLLYLGTHLKETVMVFMVVAALHTAIKIMQLQKRNWANICLLLALFFGLFMFRTVLATVLIGSIAMYGFWCNPTRYKAANVSITLLLIAAFCFIIFNSEIGTEINGYLEKIGVNQSQTMQFKASRDNGNKFALLAGAPLFLSVIIMAPFPSFVFVPLQDMIWMFIGANFIRNIYAWFAITGLIYCARHAFRKTSLLIFYMMGYLLVLANSGFAISERFHLPAVPALIILSSIGISNIKPKARRFFPWYLALICVIILVWNYVKLAGRV